MSKALRKTRKLYGDLMGRARFRAAVEIAASGDVGEAEHLITSARWVEGAARDPEMMAGLRELRDMMVQFDRATATGLAWLTLLEFIRPRVSIAVEATRRGEPSDWLGDLALDVMDGTAEMVAGTLKAIRHAYIEIGAERLGLSPEAMLAVVPDWCAEAFVQHEAAIAAAPVPEERLVFARRAMLGGWGPEGLGGVREPEED